MQRISWHKIAPMLLAVSLVATNVHASTHYLLGYSSVDSGKGIEWGGTTAYSTNINSAITTWNALRKVTISADTAWTLEDVTFSDRYDSTVSWDGQYTYKGSCCAETIQLNSFYFSSYSTAQKQHVATHELGHALGLAHSVSGNIMYSITSTQTSLGSQDTSDYSYLYP